MDISGIAPVDVANSATYLESKMLVHCANQEKNLVAAIVVNPDTGTAYTCGNACSCISIEMLQAAIEILKSKPCPNTHE